MALPESPQADILATLAAAAGGRTHKPRSICWFQRLLLTDPEMAAKARLAIESDYSARIVAEVLTNAGAPVDRQIISRHRTGDCVSCRTS